MGDLDFLGFLGIGSQLAGVGLNTVAAYNKSIADKTALEMQAVVADTNEQLDEFRAADALARGKEAVNKSKLATRQLAGTQRAELAARGLTLDSETPINILSDTEFMGARDANILHLNALKEAWGYKVQAGNDANQGELLRYRAGMESPSRSAMTTALTGAGSVAASWYNLNKAGVGIGR